MSIELSTTYKTTNCCVCNISFAMPSEFYEKRLKDHKEFYCPNGHAQHFISKTEEEKLKEEINRLEEKIGFIRSCKKQIEYSRRHWKGEVTKLKKRGK